MTRSRTLIFAAFAAGLVVGALAAWTGPWLRARPAAVAGPRAVYCAPAGHPALRPATQAPESAPAPALTCSALVELAGPAGKDARTAIPAWETLILGSSVLAALAAAACNARAATKARSGSLSDTAFSAYLRFHQDAHRYLERMEVFANGRPSAETLKACYDEVHAILSRLSEPARQQIALLESAYGHLANWPKGEAGMPPLAARYAETAHARLGALENSMRDLGKNGSVLSQVMFRRAR